MDYKIDPRCYAGVFAVPSCVVDEYLRMSGAAQLKVLLWYLRSGGDACVSGAAKALRLSEADVKDALQYWVETGVMLPPESGASDTVEAVVRGAQTQSEDKAAEGAANTCGSDQKAATVRPERVLPTRDEVTRLGNADGNIKLLVDEAEMRMGKPMSQAQISTLVWLYDYVGIPVPVLLMIVGYAVSQGKGNMRYIETVALNWHDEGIDTVQAAEKKISELDRFHRQWGEVCRIFGVEMRKPSKREEELVKQWLDVWKLSEDELAAAYEECINHTGKLSFAYIGKVLDSAHRSGGENNAVQIRRDKGKPSFDMEAYKRLAAELPPLPDGESEG